MYYSANYPDILLSNIDINPTLTSPNAVYSISFALTKEQTYDFEEYKRFLDSAIRNFRQSKFYTHYKHYLYSLGIDCCQFHPNITSNSEQEVASLEMHHCMLNIYDIAIIITEHILATQGMINEFDLSDLLKIEHANNNIPIVMLCKSCHQKYHHQFLYVYPEMIFGKWWELLYKYPEGWTREIMDKVFKYINRGLGEKRQYREKDNARLLELRDEILNWAGNKGVLLDGKDLPEYLNQ